MDTYQCKVCKLEYTDEKIAKECEVWCSTHESLYLLLTQQAINKNAAKDLSITDDERFKE